MDEASLPSPSRSFYRSHVFCCTNWREPGSKRGCCAEKDSETLQDYFKKRVKELGIPKTRINKAGCLDRCELGPVMVIYPEGTWYHYRSEADVEEILQQHLLAGKRVERLMI